MLVQLLATNSNVNHTCPFNVSILDYYVFYIYFKILIINLNLYLKHDIIMRKMILNPDLFRRFPLSNGDFLLDFRVGAYNKWRANIQLYFTVYNK